MRKIIGGKVYDTDTAEDLMSYSFGEGRRDLYFEENVLYRTLKGAFFVAGEGGPASQWRRTVGQNNWSGGDGIKLVSEAEAKELVENHGSAEVFQLIFGPPEEG